MVMNLQWAHTHRDGISDAELWLIHGLGDSSNVWYFLFDDPNMPHLAMTSIDLPGFGNTPFIEDNCELESLVKSLKNIILENRTKKTIVIIGHSVGGDIATMLASQYPEMIHGIINVEGNLTNADTFFSREAATSNEFGTWFENFKDKVADLIQSGDIPGSYLTSLNKCDPVAFQSLASRIVALGGDELGKMYIGLTTKKCFWYGTSSLSQESLRLSEKENLDTIPFFEANHWPMFDARDKFVKEINKFLNTI